MLSSLQVGFDIIIFSYFSAILLAVTRLLSLLGGQVCLFLKLAICQLLVVEFVDTKHTQGHVGQSHFALTLSASSLINLITFLSANPYLIMAFLNYFFPLNFIPKENFGFFLENLGYLLTPLLPSLSSDDSSSSLLLTYGVPWPSSSMTVQSPA